MKNIDSIIFDLGGVILNIDYQLTSRAFLNAGFKEFDSFYSQSKQSSLFDDFETGIINSAEFVNRICDISGLNRDEVIFCWNAMLLDLPTHRIDFLRILNKKYRLILLSNTNEIHLDAFRKGVVEKYGDDVLFELFERVYYSHEIGMRKPNVECFQFVLDENELLPERTFFIDDSTQHVEGAKKAGIHSALLPKGVDITSLFADKVQ